MRSVQALLFTACCFLLHARTGMPAKILAISPMASYSHFTLAHTLSKGLADRGHQVTLIAPYTDKETVPNLKIIELTGFHEMTEEFRKQMDMFSLADRNPTMAAFFMHGMCLEISENVLNHTNVKKLLASNEKFDAVWIEQFSNDALKGFCVHYDAACISFNAMATNYATNNVMGNPSNPSYIPDMTLNHAGLMDFCLRLKNALITVIQYIFYYTIYIPDNNKLLHKYMPNSPHIQDIDIPLVLLNSHVSTSPPVPLQPNMIEIGGYHVKPPKKLPKDLQKYLDDATEGVVYFSMGSNLKSVDMTAEKRDSILKSFAKLKMKVLWKFEDDNLPGKPKNVKIQKWCPQQEILAHPNVKLFITHGGLLSTIEAVYFGVPIIGIPIFGDQATNMLIAVNAGYAVDLKYRDLTEDTLTNALNEVLNNKKYSLNAKARSKLMLDRPMTPLDTAAFWIEYAARHKGQKHYRSAALDLAWYQYLMLDVFVVLGAILILVAIASCWVLKKCCCKKTKKISRAEKSKKTK